MELNANNIVLLRGELVSVKLPFVSLLFHNNNKNYHPKDKSPLFRQENGYCILLENERNILLEQNYNIR